MENVKAIYFDMDGTIADLYGVKEWKTGIDNGLLYPYAEAKPMWDMVKLYEVCMALKSHGYTVGVISWTSKNGTAEYNKAVREIKKKWLETYGLLDMMDEIHIVKYGTPKHTVPNLRHGILIDDNFKVREKWKQYGGDVFDPTAGDLIEMLNLLMEE